MADEESNLVRHARTELALVGNGPEIDEPIIKMVRIFSDMGHSGSSAAYTIAVLQKLLWFRSLAPLTDNPEEWYHHEDPDPEIDVWQNKRNGEAFSKDGGKTYYLLSDGSNTREVKKWYTSRDHTLKEEDADGS